MNLQTLSKNRAIRVFGTMKSLSVTSLMITAIVCFLSGCTKAQQLPANEKAPAEKKISIVYLSRTNGGSRGSSIT